MYYFCKNVTKRADYNTSETTLHFLENDKMVSEPLKNDILIYSEIEKRTDIARQAEYDECYDGQLNMWIEEMNITDVDAKNRASLYTK